MRKRDVRRMRWYVERDKFRRAWRKIAQVLACITVFCTTYALMLPAITLEMEPFCGIENHEHVSSCYEPLPVFPGEQQTELVIHSHSDLCFDRAGTQICPMEEIKEHRHSDDCYQLVIPQKQEEQPTEEVQLEQEEAPETPAVLTHTHTDECYLVQRGALVCNVEESQGHKHEDACFGYGDEPICQPEEVVEHEHTEACYETVLLCSQEESEEHLHGDGCYGPGETPVCQPELPAVHEHTEACFEKLLLCGQEETEGHLHSDACYEMEEILICGVANMGALTDAQKETDTAQTETDSQEQQAEETQMNPEEQEDAQTEITRETEPAAEITENRILVCEKQEYVAHSHSEACYETNESGEKYLACDLPQIPVHQHSEECLSLSEEMLSCNSVEEAHQHTYECYTTWSYVCEFCADDESPRTDADLETEEDWEKTFADVTLTGLWPEDVLSIAKTQLDYQESGKNYEEDETGIRRGYTRYGQWWGDPYGDWNSMFVSFCLHYADVEEFPLQDSCGSWIEELEEIQCYVPVDGYIPKVGDLIFLEKGREERFVESEEATASMIVDRVGIVAELIAPEEEKPAMIVVIEGDCDDQVREVSYELDSPEIIGYCDLPEAAEGTYHCGMESHSHGWMCKDETGTLICQKQDHIHEEFCRIRKMVYEDDLLRAEMTLTGQEKLPENLHFNVSLVTEESDQGGYRAMYSAVSEALFDSTYCLSEVAFCHMELLSDEQPYSLPEGVQADVQISFHQPLFSPADVANAQQLNTFMLREEVSAEITPEVEPLMVADIVSSEAANSYAQSNSLTAEDVPLDLTEEEPVTTAVYRASEVPAHAMENAENGITGLSFSSGQVSSFAVALADASEEINAWTQVLLWRS